jgi:hypothetical protein
MLPNEYPIADWLKAMRDHRAALNAATSCAEQNRIAMQFKPTRDARIRSLNRAFGLRNGWTSIESSFTPRYIGRRARSWTDYDGGWMDHPIHFRDSAKRNIAIVGQPLQRLGSIPSRTRPLRARVQLALACAAGGTRKLLVSGLDPFHRDDVANHRSEMATGADARSTQRTLNGNLGKG